MTRSPLTFNPVAVALTAAVLLLVPVRASAAVFSVDSTADAVDANPGDGICAAVGGECTLRAAVLESNQTLGPDEITIPAGSYVLTVAGQPEDDGLSGDLDVLDDVIIRGAGATSTVIDAAGAEAVISIGGTDVTIRDLTLTRGSSGLNVSTAVQSRSYAVSDCIIEHNSEAGIRLSHTGPNQPDTLAVVRTAIRDNGGNGIWVPFWSVNLAVEDSVISRNSGAGIDIFFSIGGTTSVRSTVIEDNQGSGIRVSDTGVIVEDTIVRRNGMEGIASWEGGVRATRVWIDENTGLGIRAGGGFTLDDSAVTRNGVGGIECLGFCSLHVRSSTISGNSGGIVGGVHVTNTYSGSQIHNSSIVGNSGSSVGGVSRGYLGGIAIFGSIIAGNTTPSGPSDCGATTAEPGLIPFNGGNLVGNSSGCDFTSTATDQIGTAANPIDPMLGPLAMNGGATPTHSLLPGSPALDAGSETCPATDQRGASRPFDGDGDGIGACDAGAYEASDFDSDAVGDLIDNCPLAPNPTQLDADGDGTGDACNDELDADGDEWADTLDNCAAIPNPDQLDPDGDGLGTVCDPFPLDPDNEQAQCEADLGVRGEELEVCSVDLDQCLAQLAVPSVLLETAGMGLEGENFQHFGVNGQQFVGARFQVLAPAYTGSVGAHIVETYPEWSGAPGGLFAAIVRLSGPDDFPNSFELSTSDVVGSALLPLPIPGNSTEVAADLAVPLDAGWYALVLGSGRLGATGGGAITLNNPVVASPSAFIGFVGSQAWSQDAGLLLGARLFVRTEAVDLLSCQNDLSLCEMTLIEGNGDVNGDGVSDVVDSVMFRRWLAGYPNP
ncbi:MAG: choice-of-anchor Q domain-containing protein [Myxococcota bacterium]